jgi:hypothetical protein
MTMDAKNLKKQEKSAQRMIWLAGRASRNRSLLDKACRWMVTRATHVTPEEDFMRDAFVDNDQGFDPAELDRFQRGEQT